MDCGLRAYELYFRFVNQHIPDLLRNVYVSYPTFYVKGGKAVDSYLTKKIGSPDWDIVYYYKSATEIETVHKHILGLLDSFMTIFVNSPTTSIIFEKAKYNEPGKPELDMIQYGIVQDACRLFFLDVVFQQGVYPGSTVKDGIPIQRIEDLKANMTVVAANRNKQVENLKSVSNLWKTNFESSVQKHTLTNNEAIEETLDLLKADLQNCGCDIDAILEHVDYIRELEQDNAKRMAYTLYNEFRKDKAKEQNMIQKQNITRKRNVRLRNVKSRK